MLILTRKPGESLRIGDDVRITVIEMKGNQVRIGIAAPSTMRIYREEIYLQIQEENRKAAASNRGENGVPVGVADIVEGLAIPRVGVLTQRSGASLGVAVKPGGDAERPEPSTSHEQKRNGRAGACEE